MINSRAYIESQIAASFGHRLIAVQGAYYSDGQTTDSPTNPIEIMFSFEGCEDWKLKCAPDGESLLLEDSPIEDIDMQEYGKVLRINVSDKPPFVELTNNSLEEAFLLISQPELVVGIKLRFIYAPSLIIINVGDEIQVHEEIPSAIVSEKDFEIRRIN